MEPKPRPERLLIPYYRVSTAKQGRSGLGLEGQQAAVAAYVKTYGGVIIRSYTEVETGKASDRPELANALSDCKLSKATLVIAKMDRLTRKTSFFLRIYEEEVPVVYCDFPTVPPGPMGKAMLTNAATWSELEGSMISERTRIALAAYKARGGLLGSRRPGAHRLKGGANPRASQRAGEVSRAKADAAYHGLKKVIERIISKYTSIKGKKPSLRVIADELTRLGYATRRGKPWNQTQVKRILDRIKTA
jgi:DNA invertase Pin-like site-specific DNA recombinase